MEYYVYIVRCSDGTFYTGITNDIQKRLHAHNSLKTGAKYTRSRRPVTLVYQEKCTDKSEAQKREYKVRVLKKIEKEALVQNYVKTSIDKTSDTH